MSLKNLLDNGRGQFQAPAIGGIEARMIIRKKRRQFAGRGMTIAGVVAGVVCCSALLTVSCQASTNVTANVMEIIFTQVTHYADGKVVNSGKPVDYIPFWTPNGGVNQGPPIWHPRTPAFQISFAGTNVQATLLGTKHTLTRVQVHPPLYMEASSGMTVRLNHESSDDTNAVKEFAATVSLPALGVRDGLYECKETKAGSSIFAHNFPEMDMFINSPSNSQPAKLEIAVSGTEVAATFVHWLPRSKADALLYTNQVSSVRFLGNPAYYSMLKVAFTQTEGLSNTVVQFKRYGRSLYRNYEPPIPTSVPPKPMSEDAPFYVEVHASDLGNTAKQPIIAITVDTEKGEVEIGRLSLTFVGNGVWRSVKPAVIVGVTSKLSEVAPSDRKSYLFLRAPADTISSGEVKATLLSPDSHPYPILKEKQR
ncbi:MAG: hypothetical protein HZA88_18725 [Verrucomicrobia bacterium]|nr:hypothetical protein [Verrucomicrobiota bacterium]